MIYQMMYYGGIVASTLLFLILLLLFYKQKIYRIFCDLSGITAKKTINAIQQTPIQQTQIQQTQIQVHLGDTTQKLAAEETTVLQEVKLFEMITDIMEIHSKEVI